MKYLKKFSEHLDYTVYINGQDRILPNVSYCQNEDEVHYNPPCIITITGDNVTTDTTEVNFRGSLELQLNVAPNCYVETIEILMGNTDITSTAWDQLHEKIIINKVTDDISINITTSSTQQDRGYFAPLRIMNNNGVMSTGRLYFAVNTAVGSGSTVLCKPVFPEWLSYSSEYIGGNSAAFIQDYFYTTTASTTKYGYRKVSCSETIPIGKYKLPFSWQTESSPTWYQSNSVIEIVPYERKVLNGTDTEVPYDEFDLDSRDITLNRSFVANEWTSICLPFNVSESKLKQAFGDDVQLAYLDEDSTTIADDTCSIHLTTYDVSYGLTTDVLSFIKPSKNLSSVDFDDVIIDPDNGSHLGDGIGRGNSRKTILHGLYVTYQYDEEDNVLTLRNGQLIHSTTIEAYDFYICDWSGSCDFYEIYVDNEFIADFDFSESN